MSISLKQIPFILRPLSRLGLREKQFPINRYGKKTLGTEKEYLDLHRELISKKNSVVDQIEAKYKIKIGKRWINNLALYTQVTKKKSSLDISHGRLLYTYLSDYLVKYKKKNKFPMVNILETGTARGFSAICMAKALIDAGVPGNINTLDYMPHESRLIWNCIDDIYGPKSRKEILSRWPKELLFINFIQCWTEKFLKSFSMERINFAFLDASHTYKDVMLEFLYINEKQEKGDLIFFDDVSPGAYDGVSEAVKYIDKTYNYEIDYVNISTKRGFALARKVN